MGKNLTADWCNFCEKLLYYGESCKKCEDIEREIQEMIDNENRKKVGDAE